MEFKKADALRTVWRLALCFVCAGGVLVPINAQDTGDNAKLNDEINTLRSQYKEELTAIEDTMAQARTAAGEKKFGEANSLYSNAQQTLQKMDGEYASRVRRRLDNELSKFRADWSGHLMERAQSEFQNENFEDAINFASEAAVIDSRRGKAVQKMIDLCRQAQKGKGFARNTSLEVFSPEHKERERQIDKLYREATVFYNNRRYDEARDRLEEIYLYDPFNVRANRLLEKCYRQLYKYGLYRHATDLEGMIAYNTWEWVQGVPPQVSERAISAAPQVKTVSPAETHSKLESIIFQNVEFDDADIYSVIRYLDRSAKRNDPEQNNISIIPGFDNVVAATLPRVTMSFSRIPLSEVLRYLCKLVGLRFKMEQNTVVIGQVDDMETRYFNISPELISNIKGTPEGGDAGGAAAGTAPGGGMDFGAAADAAADSGSRNKIDPKALIAYFERCGITFNEDASIGYDTRSGKLIVTNTIENLRKTDELLRQLDSIKFQMVMIEMKIVEINQKDVNELGFDWVFNIPGTSGGTEATQTWSVNKNGQGNPLRYYSPDNPNAIASTADLSSSGYKLLNDFKIFPNFGDSIFGKGMDVNLSLSVNAIAQDTRTETLSAPKILTSSGSQAMIKMIEERYYAEDWDEPETSISGNNVSIRPPTPDWGEGRKIGITMNVRPVVSPDNFTIELHLQPVIMAFLGEDIYPVAIKTWRTKADGTKVDQRSQDTDIKMPRFSERSIDVRVKVYNGETIVVGGMIQNQNINRNDKWPIIGEIPVLGRLFSSQLALVEKTNMLIFVTTRLVNTDGKPVPGPNQDGRGMPNFNR
jgi:general secretion pathway protein D